MSAPWNLYRLYSLDPSSLDFLPRLHSLIRHDKEEQYLSSLQGSQLTRLVDFLDEALSSIPTTDNVARECLHKLQAICSRRTTLPSSYTVSDDLTRVDDHPIALGAIADVWKGTYRGNRVSIKCLSAPLNDDQTIKQSFFEGAVMWKRLSHPNIVPFIGITTNPLQIVSEWMPKGTLMEFIERNPGTSRISLLLDVAEGLGYLHANNTIHGNLNGPSILVDYDGHARLTDFELTPIARGMDSATHENRYAAPWAAPEIHRGANPITWKADVFAFGMVVIEVFTGKHPFSEFATPVIISKIMGGERPARPQEAQERGLTDSVWDMTVRCWHQDPPQRPTMMEVARLVRKCYRMAATWRTEITDIPVKVLIDNILPLCEIKDVLSLGCTNRFFDFVTTDSTFWREKLAVDYNFTGSETTGISSWKFIYQRLRNPQVFVWGQKEEGQLGLPQFPKTTFSDVPFPVELHLPGVHVVSLATSQTASHVLSADGSVYVWGTLRGHSTGSEGPGFSSSSTTAWTPLKLQLPAPTCTISCGEFHVMTLDTNSTVWTFTSWGRPFQLISPLLDCSSPETTPIQIECGWESSAVLTKSGDVYVWWLYEGAFGEQYWEAMAKLDEDESTKAIVPDGGTVIPCHTWKINLDPIKLPILPRLPDLLATGLPEEEYRKETKLIKISAFDNSLVGLTNKGHVLKMDELYMENSTWVWHYLPNYSEIDKVKKHPAFHTTTGNNGQERPPQVELSSDTMFITHLSGYGKHFFAYSSSMVLKGEYKTTPEVLPIIIPELQNKSIISVVHGYDHFGALTSSGKLLTWGRYWGGALGLGDPSKLPPGSPGGYMSEEEQIQPRVRLLPPNVAVPSEVRFDHGLKAEGRVERYCFAVAAGAWHTAALVVDFVGDEVPPEDLRQYLKRAM